MNPKELTRQFLDQTSDNGIAASNRALVVKGLAVLSQGNPGGADTIARLIFDRGDMGAYLGLSGKDPSYESYIGSLLNPPDQSADAMLADVAMKQGQRDLAASRNRPWTNPYSLVQGPYGVSGYFTTAWGDAKAGARNAWADFNETWYPSTPQRAFQNTITPDFMGFNTLSKFVNLGAQPVISGIGGLLRPLYPDTGDALVDQAIAKNNAEHPFWFDQQRVTTPQARREALATIIVTVATMGRGGAGAAEGALPEGMWINTNERMSDFSLAYQKFITGAEGKAYQANGVKFDGVEPRAYVDAKGNYDRFVQSKTGEFYKSTKVGKGFLNQADRQTRAAGDTPINWYFAQEKSANAARILLREEGFGNIRVIHKPYVAGK